MKHVFNFFRCSSLLMCLFILQGSQLQAQLTEKLDSIIQYGYDTANGTNYLEDRIVFEYDAQRNNTFWIWYERDTNLSSWMPQDSAGYTYNSSGQRTEEIYGEWDNSANAFLPEERSVFVYNSQGLLSEQYNFNYNSGTSGWDSSSYYLYQYNSNDQVTIYEAYYWSTSSMVWAGDERSTYSYNGSNQLVEELEYNWDMGLSAWKTQPDNKEEYLYNASTNFLDTAYYYNWNGLSSMFETTFRSIYHNDALGNQLKKEDQNYSAGPGWRTTSLYEQSFDVGSPLSQIALPINYVIDFEDSQVSKMLTNIDHQFDYNQNVLYREDSATYFYSPTNPIGISEMAKVNNVQINMFPNPASEYVRIELTQGVSTTVELNIFDSNGRNVYSKPFQENANVPLNGLSRGIYVVRLNGQDLDISEKLTIE